MSYLTYFELFIKNSLIILEYSEAHEDIIINTSKYLTKALDVDINKKGDFLRNQKEQLKNMKNNIHKKENSSLENVRKNEIYLYLKSILCNLELRKKIINLDLFVDVEKYKIEKLVVSLNKLVLKNKKDIMEDNLELDKERLEKPSKSNVEKQENYKENMNNLQKLSKISYEKYLDCVVKELIYEVRNEYIKSYLKKY